MEIDMIRSESLHMVKVCTNAILGVFGIEVFKHFSIGMVTDTIQLGIGFVTLFYVCLKITSLRIDIKRKRNEQNSKHP